MGSSLYFFILMHLLLLLSCSNFTKLAHSALSSLQQLCHNDESSALLQFKQSFLINTHASGYSSAYPKVLSWTIEGENGNCCSWDGIECDNHTGHVIGLDLSSSFLYGSINSNSTLFRLVHLQSLNLANNHFNYSQIPSRIHNLSKLRSLNLSGSLFFGQIPSELLELSKLAILDLSANVDPWYSQSLLKLEKPSLSDLVENLPNLQVLALSYVNISSNVPKTMVNLSSLSSLCLKECGLFGNFPSAVLSLPNLRFLSVRFNSNLTGYLPEFYRGSLLEILRLGGTSFSGKLPDSIGNLDQLNMFDIYNCSFSGLIPSSVGNLIKLTYLDLSKNHFTGQIPYSVGNLIKLTILVLQNNNLSGTIPQTFIKGSNLEVIDLSQNHLNGPVPRSLSNCKMLENLNLGNNHISDIFPYWLGILPEMKILVLRYNKFYGTVDGPLTNFDFPKLRIIDISWNGFSGELPLKYFPIWSNMKVQEDIGKSKYAETRGVWHMGNCSVSNIYSHTIRITNKGTEMFYYKIQSVFKAIDLSGNKFKGKIPETIGVLKGLQLLNLSNNALTGPIPISLGNLTALESLDLSQNELSGEIPQQLVQLTFLEVFNVSRNHLTGPIPRGKQFYTFENSSFDGNSGLCGDPLSKKCGNSVELPSVPSLTFEDEIRWNYHIVTTRYHVWFVRKFGKQPKWKRVRKGRRRN